MMAAQTYISPGKTGKNGRPIMAEAHDHLPFATLETDDKLSRNSTVTSDNPKTVILVKKHPLCILLFCILLLCLACAVLSTIVVLRWKCNLEPKQITLETNTENLKEYAETKENICTTRECLTESVNILRTLKRDVDPCDDFASFSCDGGSPEYKQKQDVMLARLRELVENVDVPDSVSSAIRKWKDYYSSCLYGLSEERETRAVRRSLAELDGLALYPNDTGGLAPSLEKWDLTGALINLRKSLGVKGHVFFDHCCGPDGREITISGYWKGHFCDVHDVAPKRQFLKVLARLVGDEDYDTFAEGVLTVDDEILCQGGASEDSWSTMTISQLKQIFPTIDWTRYLREVHNVGRVDIMSVRIWHRQQFTRLGKDLGRLLQNPATKRQLRDYLVFGFLMSHMNILPRSFDRAYEEYLTAINSPQASVKDNERWVRRSRWRWCLHGGKWQEDSSYSRYLNNLSPITASMMVRTSPNHLSRINRAAEVMRDYWSRMKTDIVNRMSNSNKLDSNDKLATQQALENVRLNVGLPGWLTDDEELDRAYAALQITNDSPSFYDNALAVMRFDDVIDARTLHASQAANLLSTHGSTDGEFQADMGYGALLEFDDQQALKSTLLGSLGVRLGDLVTFPIRLGSESADYLSDADRNDWQNCIVNSLNTALRPEWRRHFPSGFKLDPLSPEHGYSTARAEYLSQAVLGISTTLRLYRTLVRREAEPKLPGLDFSPDQIFFISTAQMSCFGQPSNDTLTDDYVFTKIRTNAMMSLLPGFSRAFQCGAQSRMNQTHQCSVWPY